MKTKFAAALVAALTIGTVAVSGTSRQVCAFGRWSTANGSEYVTMANVPSCAASAAPTTGWTTEAGGSNQDLPAENGF